MKLSTLAEEVLNELQGISFDARVWAPIIRSYIKISKKPKVKNIDINGKDLNPEPDEVLINGKEYPKQYRVFPIDFIHFKVNPAYLNGAEYDENKSGYDENKQYHVYFTFGDEANYSSINHELKHAFEDFQRLSKGHPGLKSTKEAINLFSGDFNKFMMSRKDKEVLYPISTLVEGLYYTSKIERSAFSDTVYDEPTFAEIIKYIKMLMQVANPTDILQRNKPDMLGKKWDYYKQNYHIPVTDKFKTYEDFIRWACDEINYKGNITLKKLRKVQYFGQEHKKEGGK
jgi:hypothetical protein